MAALLAGAYCCSANTVTALTYEIAVNLGVWGSGIWGDMPAWNGFETKLKSQ
jgi:hypothetical protein